MKHIFILLILIINFYFLGFSQANYINKLKKRFKLPENQILVLDKDSYQSFGDFLIINNSPIFLSGSYNNYKLQIEEKNSNKCLGITKKSLDTLINYKISNVLPNDIDDLKFINKEIKEILSLSNTYLIVFYNNSFSPQLNKLLKIARIKSAKNYIKFYIIPTDFIKEQ